MFALPSKRRRAAAILRDEAGATALEFATLAPAFIWVMLMICQTGLYMYYSVSLTNATNAAARKVMTGAVANMPNMTADMFRNQVLCPLLPTTMSCSTLITNIVTVPSTGSFYNVPAPAMDNTQTSFCIGGGGNYVILEVYYPMQVIGIPAMLNGAVFVGGNPSIYINANSVFVNEPFTSSYSSPAGC